MYTSETVIQLAAIIFTMLIPIVGIICGIYAAIRKKQNDTELRRMIIENQVDIETAKALMAEPEKKPDKYASLRGACVLIGIGAGALADYLLGIKGLFFWLVIAFGIGLGLLASFFIEMKLQKKE